jgi:hypothetical protein
VDIHYFGDKKMPPAPLVCTEAIISHIEIHRHCRGFHTRCLIAAHSAGTRRAIFPQNAGHGNTTFAQGHLPVSTLFIAP